MTKRENLVSELTNRGAYNGTHYDDEMIGWALEWMERFDKTAAEMAVILIQTWNDCCESGKELAA